MDSLREEINVYSQNCGPSSHYRRGDGNRKIFSGNQTTKTVGELYCSEELKEERLGELIFVSVLNIFSVHCGISGDTLILVALHKGTSLNKPSRLLFLNLAITDLCVGIIAEPLFVAYSMSVLTERWDICYYADNASLITGAILCSVSLFTSTAISVERLLALLLGLRYTYIVTMRKAYLSAIVMWILSAFIGAANYSFHFLIIGWSTFITISLCVVISSLCYGKIFFTLRQRQFHVQDGAFQGELSQKIPLNIARYRKTVYSALWVQVTLLVCYLRFGIAMALRPESPEKSDIAFSVYLAGNNTLTFVLANSSLNPFLYCWKIREVRKAVKEKIRHFFCSSN